MRFQGIIGTGHSQEVLMNFMTCVDPEPNATFRRTQTVYTSPWVIHGPSMYSSQKMKGRKACPEEFSRPRIQELCGRRGALYWVMISAKKILKTEKKKHDGRRQVITRPF